MMKMKAMQRMLQIQFHKHLVPRQAFILTKQRYDWWWGWKRCKECYKFSSINILSRGNLSRVDNAWEREIAAIWKSSNGTFCQPLTHLINFATMSFEMENARQRHHMNNKVVLPPQAPSKLQGYPFLQFFLSSSMMCVVYWRIATSALHTRKLT